MTSTATRPADPAAPRLRRSRIPWRYVVPVWSLPAVVDVVDTFISRRVHGETDDFWRIAALISPGWLVWVVFTPVIFRLGEWIRLQRPIRPAPVIAHLALSVIAGLLHALVLTACVQLLDNRPLLSNMARYAMSVQDWLSISMMLYWMTLGAGYAIEGARRERAQTLRTAALEGQLARSELAVLRAQLHPHFLFNALNTAVSLVRANEPESGVRVLTHLSDLLRQLVNGVEQEVTLGNELRMLESYLEIERARFGARLTIDVDVPDALRHAYVPGLVLQPLLENALRHGVGRRVAPGRVLVEGRVRNGRLELRVCDDGPGLSETAPVARPAGVGIPNTRARLLRLYGASASLVLRNVASGGAEAVVSMPFRDAPVVLGSDVLVTTSAEEP